MSTASSKEIFDSQRKETKSIWMMQLTAAL
jgi:hypothetical protein